MCVFQSTPYQSWNIFEKLHRKVYSFFPLCPQHGGNGILTGLTTRPWSLWQRHSKTGESVLFFFSLSLFHFTRRGSFFLTEVDKDSCESSLRLGAEPTHSSSSSSSDFLSLLFPLFSSSFFFVFSHFHFTLPTSFPSSHSLSNSSHFVSVPLNVSFTSVALYKNALKSFDIAAERGGTMLQTFIFQ